MLDRGAIERYWAFAHQPDTTGNPDLMYARKALRDVLDYAAVVLSIKVSAGEAYIRHMDMTKNHAWGDVPDGEWAREVSAEVELVKERKTKFEETLKFLNSLGRRQR